MRKWWPQSLVLAGCVLAASRASSGRQPVAHGHGSAATSGFPGQLRRNRRVSHFRADRFEQRFDPALRDSTRDEDDAAAAIIRRPTLEPGGRVKDVLDAVDHRRPVGALRNVHDALEPQQIGAAMLGERFEK